MALQLVGQIIGEQVAETCFVGLRGWRPDLSGRSVNAQAEPGALTGMAKAAGS